MKTRNRVREVRSLLGITQRRLASVSQVSPITLRQIERDCGYEPSLRTVRRLAEALDCTDVFWLERVEEAGTTAVGE